MPIDPQEELQLIDASGNFLGRVAIDRIEGHRLVGQFCPDGSFVKVCSLFEEFENAVCEQLFHDVDRITEAIDELGLRLVTPDGTEGFQIQDVQVIGGKVVSCLVPNLAIVQTESNTVKAS